MPLGRVNVHPKDQRQENGRNPQQREAHTRGRKYADQTRTDLLITSRSRESIDTQGTESNSGNTKQGQNGDKIRNPTRAREGNAPLRDDLTGEGGRIIHLRGREKLSAHTMQSYAYSPEFYTESEAVYAENRQKSVGK